MGADDPTRDDRGVIVLEWLVATAATASLVALVGLGVAAGASAIAVTRLWREDQSRSADLDRVLDEVLSGTREPV